ncbi:MAG: M3 family oligoendopeptidase [Phototrophicaceae bacterium]
MVTLKRADVPKEQTWNRESVFATWDDFKAEYDAIIAAIPELASYQGRLSESRDVVVEYFDKLYRLRRRAGRLSVYVGLATAVDTSDVTAKTMEGLVFSLFGQLSAAVAFDVPELLAMGDELRNWARDDERLSVYAHYFDNLLRQQDHTQSAAVERLLGMLKDTFAGPFSTYGEMVNTDLKFPNAVDSNGHEHRVAQDIVPPTGIKSTDRTLRQDAWYKFCDGHKAVENTLASNLITNIKQNVFLARARGYDTVLEAQLAPANLPVAVFDNLVNTFEANLSVWHRYWEAKRKALRIETMHPYDIWAPLTENPPLIDYNQAVDWIVAGLEPLGEEFTSILRKGATTDRWVDYAQNEGRTQGAFSSACYDCPPFIFNTFDGSLTGMSVLAHELGHSMHSYWMDQNQPEVYNGYFADGTSGAIAETASNFHQAMTRVHLLTVNPDDKDFQLSLIEEAMFNFHRYFFIMPTLARLEREIYKRAENNQPLSAAILNELTSQFFGEGYGDALTDEPTRTATTWMQFQHLYVPYYTFQYSVGISAAHALADNIHSGKPHAANNYLNFIGAGWSRYAIDLFKLGGVDMTSSEPIEQTFAVMEKLVERLEALVS